jgi:hypothetical protein
MSVASKTFLAVVFAAGLAVTNAQAAVQSFSIALTDLTPEHNSSGGLSADIAAFGGQPAKALQHNGSYVETLTGNYAVTDNLPPSNEAVFWQTFTQITLNGNPFFTANELVGPESPDQIWQAILNITNLKPALLMLIVHVLENNNYLSLLNGEFDYGYNFAQDDRTVGTFAVASTENLGLLSAFGPLSEGDNTWSLTFSATVTSIPEPPTWLMLTAGGAGLLVIRALATRPNLAPSLRSRGAHLARLSWKKS